MPKFTEDWFSKNIKNWNREFARLKGKPLRFLEVGSFEGRSAIWLLENVLSHPKSEMYCIDNWSVTDKNNKNAYSTFISNIKPWASKVKVLKGDSAEMLRNLKREQFDFIYIDANHHSKHVLEDAVLSWPLLKKGGMLIFDDYTHNKEHDINCPRIGIDAFLNTYVNDLKVVKTTWQVIIQKRTLPLKSKPCFSELFKEPN